MKLFENISLNGVNWDIFGCERLCETLDKIRIKDIELYTLQKNNDGNLFKIYSNTKYIEEIKKLLNQERKNSINFNTTEKKQRSSKKNSQEKNLARSQSPKKTTNMLNVEDL